MAENPERGDEKRRLNEIDPAVADLLSQGERRQEELSLSPADRRKLAREREKQSKRNRKVLDLPEEITGRLEALAQKYRCPESQIAAFLLAHGLQELDEEAIDLTPYLQPSRSPRYDHVLKLPGIGSQDSEER